MLLRMLRRHDSVYLDGLSGTISPLLFRHNHSARLGGRIYGRRGKSASSVKTAFLESSGPKAQPYSQRPHVRSTCFLTAGLARRKADWRLNGRLSIDFPSPSGLVPAEG